MNEIVERVARAIYEGRNGKGAIPWPKREWSHRAPYIKDARAAIEAMREPTDRMRERMSDNLVVQYEGSDAEEAKELVEDLKVEWLWMRGVDGALEE